MPHANIHGVELYYEEAGAGTPILFIHELAGDYRSWEPQVRALARNHRCVRHSARGYWPSGIPASGDQYSQKQSASDAIALLDHLGIQQAHIVGLSMGGFVSTQILLDHPERVLSATIASCGSGSEPEVYQTKQAEFHAMSERVALEGAAAFVQACENDSTRRSFKQKDPAGWAEFISQLAEHDSAGLSYTLKGVQGGRPSLWDFESRLKEIDTPVLILCGDQDTPCMQPSLFLARTLRNAQLAVIPGSGHVLNLEEPAFFNQLLKDFIHNI